MTDSPCPNTRTIDAFVSGQIDDDELPGISNHLVDCERCYATVAAKARLMARFERIEDTAPPMALLPALLTGTVIAVVLTASLLLLLF